MTQRKKEDSYSPKDDQSIFFFFKRHEYKLSWFFSINFGMSYHIYFSFQIGGCFHYPFPKYLLYKGWWKTRLKERASLLPSNSFLIKRFIWPHIFYKFPGFVPSFPFFSSFFLNRIILCWRIRWGQQIKVNWLFLLKKSCN